MTHLPFPTNITVECHLCPTTTIGANSMIEHMEDDHGLLAQRWSDGGPVVDMTDVPELAERAR